MKELTNELLVDTDTGVNTTRIKTMKRMYRVDFYDNKYTSHEVVKDSSTADENGYLSYMVDQNEFRELKKAPKHSWFNTEEEAIKFLRDSVRQQLRDIEKKEHELLMIYQGLRQ
ncbi:MAG: hypothetical protein GY853_14560 [PVC group bacterium]|nr:hypothetical protein [PVC group bacterium]